MKIIHCADLHLDSKMNTNFDVAKAALRRNEILHTFERMAEYADREGVDAILIAGDLFDRDVVSARTVNVVMHTIETHPHIGFYYLKGNHDKASAMADAVTLPDNLFLFSDWWTTYELGEYVTVTGMELTSESATAFERLVLPVQKYNIVMLHGQESEFGSENAETVPLRTLRGKNIDYLALGHIHSYKEAVLDARGTYCYPGCLEGRGFDECGEHGFVLMTVDCDRKSAVREFIPFASRRFMEISVDITGCRNSADITGRIKKELPESGCRAEDMVRVILTGETDVEDEKDVSYPEIQLQEMFFLARIEDHSSYRVDIEKLDSDQTLRGEFVRSVLADSTIEDTDRNMVIRYGLAALLDELKGEV